MLSDALWQRRFNRDPSILNRNITLNGESFTVVGVMPRGFFFPLREIELWTPWAMEPEQASGRGDHYLGLVGRLKPDVSIERANADLAAIGQRFCRIPAHKRRAASSRARCTAITSAIFVCRC